MEAAATATKLDNILQNKGNLSPYRKFYKEEPAYEKHLRTFGEMGVVALYPGETIKAHFNDWGIKCMFLLGYAAHHAGSKCLPEVGPKNNEGPFHKGCEVAWKSFQDNKKTNQTMYQEDIGEDLITPLPTNKAPEDMQAIHEDENQEVEELVGQPRLSSQPFPDHNTFELYPGCRSSHQTSYWCKCPGNLAE
jgi:hypothetical protein